jgi:hypothetical protein
MPRRKSRIFVLVVVMIAVPLASQTAKGGGALRAHAVAYRLDDSLGSIALYPGLGYRSYVALGYMVPSLDELERRVGQLPPDTKLHWDPYKRDPSGKPILFSDGQYDHFAKVCRDREIELLVSAGESSNRKSD